jgi:hypothetical protein
MESVPPGEDPIAWVRYGRAAPLATVKQEVRQMSLPTVGTHAATAAEASIYESDGGAVMLAIRCATTDGCTITTHQCLVQKDGTPSERTLKNLREVFGVDMANPFDLVDKINAGDPTEFDIVVEADTWEGKDTVRVAWINPKGKSGGAALKQGDRSTILAKYGAKFRAVAGPVPVKPKAPAAPKPPPPTPAAEDTRASRYGASTMERAWQAVCQGTPGLDQQKRADAWRAYLAKQYPGKQQGDLTPEEWGEVEQKAPRAIDAATADIPI